MFRIWYVSSLEKLFVVFFRKQSALWDGEKMQAKPNSIFLVEHPLLEI